MSPSHPHRKSLSLSAIVLRRTIRSNFVTRAMIAHQCWYSAPLELWLRPHQWRPNQRHKQWLQRQHQRLDWFSGQRTGLHQRAWTSAPWSHSRSSPGSSATSDSASLVAQNCGCWSARSDVTLLDLQSLLFLAARLEAASATSLWRTQRSPRALRKTSSLVIWRLSDVGQRGPWGLNQHACENGKIHLCKWTHRMAEPEKLTQWVCRRICHVIDFATPWIPLDTFGSTPKDDHRVRLVSSTVLGLWVHSVHVLKKPQVHLLKKVLFGALECDEAQKKANTSTNTLAPRLVTRSSV